MVDLRADVNRNGKIDLDDPSEDVGEDTWDEKHGAIFLANIDDDQAACPKDASDEDLAKCNDAADEVVNGPDDLLDLARIQVRPWPEAPDDASGTLTVGRLGAEHVRLFVKKEDQLIAFRPESTSLSAADLRAGIELAIEGKDILRDRAIWDGFLDLTLRVTEGTKEVGTDTLRMRLAPIILANHLQPAEVVYFSDLGDPSQQEFRANLDVAVTEAKVPNRAHGLELESFDQWTQDFFETAYMSMPAPNGQHAIRVAFRSANIEGDDFGNAALRTAGRIVFTHLRGKDAAGVAEVDWNHDPEMDTLNSMGNTETIPPFSFGGQKFPLGRVLRGSTESYHPDKKFSALLEAQGVQPAVLIDTSWLLVAHVDETISFVKANTPRGWAMVVADPKLARDMLKTLASQGQGGAVMFREKKWLDEEGQRERSAEVTVAQVLADEQIMASSARAAVGVSEQVDTIKQATGITESEILRLPFLFMQTWEREVAYQVGTVNGVSLGDTDFGAPNPHGPVIDGKDIFKEQMEKEFAKVGVRIHWIEDWDLYHRLDGEVHCATNALRQVPQNIKWWEGGR
ncbi:MAG: protein-arginine deiminase [Deltaproteobacteria bacterium]|nr:protein-arginine deiminase [Deltaproteobacteria bacterium]